MTEQLQTEPAPPARRATLLDLSLTQLIAGSCAAATAAFLGSRVGWVGTVTGAGIGSIVSAVAASLYTASMTRAGEAVRRQKLHPRRAQSSPQSAPDSPSSSVQKVRAPRRVLATAGVLFALAVAFLTGLQLATGADVTGASLGTRQSDNQPRERAVLEDPADTPTTESVATPESTSPATLQVPAPEPTDGSGVTAPTGDPNPAAPTPTETAPSDPATPGSPTPTQPTNPASPTTPAG